MAKPAFPSNLLDFQRRFSTEDACHAFVRDSRWPDGFRCPKCGNPGAYDLSDRKAVECAKCRYQASVTAGTIMHKSKLPLQVWLWAAWLMVSSKGGVSALGYLTYDSRHADLLFEVVSRRQEGRSTLVTTNRGFTEWREVFPHATCVVALVDRLVHRAQVTTIEGELLSDN